jgi:uncharacterized membrane protein
MKSIYTPKLFPVFHVFSLSVLAVVLVILSASMAGAWNFSVPAVEVRPVNGVFEFPVAAFQDGRAKHFEYRHAPGQTVRFFMVRSTDGIVRAALDACDVCYKSKKGYAQQGNDMVCLNCGMKFRTDKINEVRGGCNPSPLKRTVKGDKIIITQQDVVSGLKYFQWE